MKFHILGLILIFLINGCTILPGMQNLNMSSMHRESVKENLPAQPVVIPINNSLLKLLEQKKYYYKIQAPDILYINIWKHPEFNMAVENIAIQTTSTIETPFNYPVNANGDIYFPLVGYLHVAGKTLDEIRIALSNQLKRYIRNPQVIVKIAEYRSQKIYVIGEVNKPSLLYLNDQKMTLMDALTLSGSINPDTGDPQYIYVIRGEIAFPRIYWLRGNTPDALFLAEYFKLETGDIVYVSTAAVTRWNRFLKQLLPTLQTVWYTKAITGK